jgi:NAD(P)H-dependent flavin oxidoreductase YrpB (nitropropane dioxygenase family)
MVLNTELTRMLGIKHPIVQGGMQWVGLPALAAAVAKAGGVGILTALTQPSPDALREAIRETRKIIGDGPCPGKFGVNITLLPSITPPDYAGYVRAAMDEGVEIFETAGNNPGPIIKLIKTYQAPGQSSVPKRFVIHKCVAVRHALSAQKMGVDCLSIDGFECAGHPGEEDIGGLVLLARAAKELKIPFISSGGIADGRGLAASLTLGAQGCNMGTRFMATVEAPIHQNIKDKIVASNERDTVHMFRTLKNTARVYKNKVSSEVVRLENRPHGAKFEELRELVAGARGKLVYENGDPDYGIWSAGISMGLIDDIPTCQELCDRMVADAEKIITGLANTVVGSKAKL